MVEIKDIATASIDPESKVNVRRSQVKEGMEKVQSSIAEHGFWESNPITIRPHPNSSSEYEYEIVVGQCRLKACLELKLEQIPAVIEKLDDDEAIRRSWAENEGKSDITVIDKAYWIKKIITRYLGEDKTITECYKIAATFFAIDVQTVIKYLPMVFLPPKVQEMVVNRFLGQHVAEVIAKHTYDPSSPESSQEAMEERAEWVRKLSPDEKKECVGVVEDLGLAASIEELDKEVKERATQQETIVKVAIPGAQLGRLMDWGKDRGLTDKATIVSHMVAETLRGA